MNRRHWLGCCTGLAAGLFTHLEAGARDAASPDADAGDPAPGLALGEGWRNPCLRAPQPLPPAQQALVDAAFDGLATEKLWDCHVHLLGTGDSGSGCRVNPSMQQWWHPVAQVRRRAILDAACVPASSRTIDADYVERLERLTTAFATGARWLLYAFDDAHDDRGRRRIEHSTFHVPDEYACAVATRASGRFAWVASIHPYRDDALARLEAQIVAGASAVKWLPSAMNIDLRDPRCRPFFDRLQASALPLIVHCGEERAVPGAGRARYGNPLHVRAALERGVRVIVAHCGSLGEAADTDRHSQPPVPAFELFCRLMDEPAHESLLLGDISAVFQANRPVSVGRRLLRRQDWHPRLLHGSDHPLPGLMPLYAPGRLAAAGLLGADAVPGLRGLRTHNPLLFDLALKRQLRHRGDRLSPMVFETARHFSTAGPGAGSEGGRTRESATPPSAPARTSRPSPGSAPTSEA